jgi:hypothetical protein
MSGESNLVVLLDEKHPEAAPHEHKDVEAALAFLKTAARIKTNMAHFTQMWEKLRPSRLKGREQKDRDILKGLAGLMANGKLRAKSRERQGGGDDADDAPRAAPPAPRKKREMSSSGMKLRERPDPAPPAPPPPPISVEQQVKALLSAARSGAPFVEQCRNRAAGE